MINVELRLYRRFDADLMALYELGVPITDIATNALISYANGINTKYLIGRSEAFDLTDRRNVHLRLTIHDEKAENLIRQIKYGYRNQFVKTLIRNTLIEQCLSPYFANQTYIVSENQRIQDILQNRNQIETIIGGNVIILDGHKKKRNYKKEILKASGKESENELERKSEKELDKNIETKSKIKRIKVQKPESTQVTETNNHELYGKTKRFSVKPFNDNDDVKDNDKNQTETETRNQEFLNMFDEM